MKKIMTPFYIKGFPIKCYFDIQRKMPFSMIGCKYHYKEEAMPLIVENNIRQMTTTTTLTGPYPFYEIAGYFE